MSITYEVILPENISCLKNLCNELMFYQKSKSFIHPEWFDNMCFETRMLPAVEKAKSNYILIAKKDNDIIGYAYSNICPKYTYSGGFATLKPVDFFDFKTVKSNDVGCLSQFYIIPQYRNSGIGSVLFKKSIEWFKSFNEVSDLFIFVSNGNDTALNFYKKNGFLISHQILDGFITVLRKPN